MPINPSTRPISGLSPHAPSILLPMRFMVAGLLALFTGVVILVIRPDLLATYHYSQHIIALTHLFVLGWISSIVMGAMYQLVPVALETRLHSERLARWQFLLHLAGFVGMVWMFWTWNMKQVGHFGSVFALSVGLFVYNILRTLMRVPRWNVVASAVASALTWLCLAVLAGLTIAVGKCTYESASSLPPENLLGMLSRGLRSVAGFTGRFDQISAMHAHAHLGAVGLFLVLIVGISCKLVPMFTLSDLQSRTRAAVSLALLNAGLLGSFFTILMRSPLKLVFTLLLLAGLACYGIELRAILRARKRRTLDWGLIYFLTAISFLVPVSLLAAVLSWPGLPLNGFTGQLENLYGFLGLMGVISFAIVGMLYKILPFLVWYRVYSARIGSAKVPSLADLYLAPLQSMAYWFYLAGLTVSSVGIVAARAQFTRWGAVLLLASLLCLAVNVGCMARHLFRPRIEPLPAPKRPPTAIPAVSV